jgi:polyisoprenoid-binding protein YceI
MTTTATTVSTWQIDPAHSVVEFAAKHMMVSTVKGRFGAVSGTLTVDEEHPERSSVTATIEAASVDTGAQMRDDHLRSADFFDVGRYPELTFHSTRVERVKGDDWKITGELTIRGVTKEVVLDTEFEGQILDAFGTQRAAFSATAQVNRKDFGLNWNGVIEAGGVVVGDKIKIELNIAAVRDEAAASGAELAA